MKTLEELYAEYIKVCDKYAYNDSKKAESATYRAYKKFAKACDSSGVDHMKKASELTNYNIVIQ